MKTEIEELYKDIKSYTERGLLYGYAGYFLYELAKLPPIESKECLEYLLTHKSDAIICDNVNGIGQSHPRDWWVCYVVDLYLSSRTSYEQELERLELGDIADSEEIFSEVLKADLEAYEADLEANLEAYLEAYLEVCDEMPAV